MNCEEALYTIKNLQMLKEIYYKMYDDPYNELYRKKELVRLVKYTNDELERLTELLHNMELYDSYDQNTGQINEIYRLPMEKERLTKLCGGVKDE